MLQTTPLGPNDEAFLFEVYASTRRAEMAAWGWAPAQQDAFLRMQFMAQHRAYAAQYPDADQRIIQYNGQRAGRILVARLDQEILLVDIALLPEFRQRGLGTALIKELQAEAAAAGKTLRLHVLKDNPAYRLYQRLGFVVTADNGMHYGMAWHVDTTRPPG